MFRESMVRSVSPNDNIAYNSITVMARESSYRNRDE
jgi:hypothetical protein